MFSIMGMSPFQAGLGRMGQGRAACTGQRCCRARVFCSMLYDGQGAVVRHGPSTGPAASPGGCYQVQPPQLLVEEFIPC